MTEGDDACVCLAHSQCLLCEFLFHSLLRRSLHIRAQEYEAAMKADASESAFQRPGQTHWAACGVDEPETERHRWHFSESSGGLSCELKRHSTCTPKGLLARRAQSSSTGVSDADSVSAYLSQEAAGGEYGVFQFLSPPPLTQPWGFKG